MNKWSEVRNPKQGIARNIVYNATIDGMNIFLDSLSEYCLRHTTALHEVLHELERETHLKTLHPHMISGPLQGQFFRFLMQLIQPKYALEIGTFTGYAAICLASGMPENSILHTIEINKELEYLIRRYIDKSNLHHKIQLHVGDALEVIPTLDATFDFAFIDATKKEYPAYYEMVMQKLNIGGYLLIDNVLWKGKVLEKNMDSKTKAIHTFNEKVQQDKRVENILLPIRDGLMLVKKNKSY